MNWWQKFKNKWFGTQYVLLFTQDSAILTEAYELGDNIYANPYLPNTRCKLLPTGKLEGDIYMKKWEPVTEKTKELYESDGKDA